MKLLNFIYFMKDLERPFTIFYLPRENNIILFIDVIDIL